MKQETLLKLEVRLLAGWKLARFVILAWLIGIIISILLGSVGRIDNYMIYPLITYVTYFLFGLFLLIGIWASGWKLLQAKVLEKIIFTPRITYYWSSEKLDRFLRKVHLAEIMLSDLNPTFRIDTTLPQDQI